MTPVQAQTLPVALKGNDVLAQAQTGSGKTAAFSIALLNALDIQNYQVQALVLCPTRELADQVAAEIRRLASALANTRVLTLCGGKPMQDQLTSLKRQPHVVVGTPGRILKHLQKQTLKLDDIQTLVLDEADRMLDMGFHDDIMKILDKINARSQTLLFSATFPEEIQQISKSIQNSPQLIRIEAPQGNSQIQQTFFFTPEQEKQRALFTVLKAQQPESCIIFCNRKQHCQELANALNEHGFHAKPLHGDLDQFERDQALIQFANKSKSILVATDVAARGLDIDTLSVVINYDFATDPETYVHRIGRTGRAGNEGLAISFVLPQEHYRLEALEEFLNTKLRINEISTLQEKPLKIRQPETLTLHINAGKKDKLRPGDIVGALTASSELANEQIGKITVQAKMAYVAVKREEAKLALSILNGGKIKGRKVRVRIL